MYSYKDKTRRDLTPIQVRAIIGAHTYQVDDQLIAAGLSPAELRNFDLGKSPRKRSVDDFTVYAAERHGIVLPTIIEGENPYVTLARVQDVTPEEYHENIAYYRMHNGWTEYEMQRLLVTYYRVHQGAIKSITYKVNRSVGVGFCLSISPPGDEIEVSAFDLFIVGGMEIFYALSEQMSLLKLAKLVK
jgi:hypothetical protein